MIAMKYLFKKYHSFSQVIWLLTGSDSQSSQFDIQQKQRERESQTLKAINHLENLWN